MLLHATDCIPKPPFCDRGEMVTIPETGQIVPMTTLRGIRVHQAIHLLNQGRLDWSTVHPPWVGYVKAAEKFGLDYGLKVYASEKVIVNETHGYRGRIDVVGSFHPYSDEWVIDWKTGVPAPTVGLQLAAYAKENNRKRCVVQLKDDGTYVVTRETDPDQTLFLPNDFSVFKCFLTAAKWEIRHGYMPMPPEREDDYELSDV